MLKIANVLYFKENEPVKDDATFVNNSLKEKLTKLLTPWEIRNFLFWIVMDSNDFKKLNIVVQSIYMDNFPTLVFSTEELNVNNAIAIVVKQYREHIAVVKNLDFENKNVIINRWWKNYLNILPKKPVFPEFKEFKELTILKDHK